jgi:hypothetical protein
MVFLVVIVPCELRCFILSTPYIELAEQQ